MIRKPTVKLPHSNKTFVTNSKDLSRELRLSSAFATKEGASHSKHNLGLFSFNNEVWQQSCGKIGKRVSGEHQVINRSFNLRLTCLSNPSLTRSTKTFFDPIKDPRIGVTNLQKRVIIESLLVLCTHPGHKVTDEEATFTINETGQISQISLAVCHNDPRLGSNSIQQRVIKIQPERLNEKALKGDAKV